MKTKSALLLIALSGCNFNSAGVLMTPENACAGDDDCTEGVCDQGICIDDSSRSVDVAVEIFRSPSDTQGVTPASWAYEPEPFSGASTRDYTLPATRQVAGVVRLGETPIPATLRFVRRMVGSTEPLAPAPVEVDTYRDPAEGERPEGYDYSTALVAGEGYDVTVVPNSDMVTLLGAAEVEALRALPPFYSSFEVEAGDSEGPFRFDIYYSEELAKACGVNELIGCTLAGEVYSTDGQLETPEPGLQVRAVEKESGRVVSSIAETNEVGRFSIRVSETASDYFLHVTSSVGREPLPALLVDPELAFADDPLRRRILIPRLERVQFDGAVRDADGNLVPNASVQFSSNAIFDDSQLLLQGSFSATTTTDEEGRFNVELLPGRYSIVVTPPEDEEKTWGILSQVTEVQAEVTTLPDLVIPSQIELLGSCTTFNDDPAVGVTVLARARSDSGDTQRSRETVADHQGDFSMSIDEGSYDVHIKVSDETGFPWLVEPELVMSAKEGPLSRDYLLPPPIVVRGMLRSSDGAVVPEAQIRAYILTDDDEGPRPLRVGETVSAEDGSYRVLISPDLDGE